jgi:hypothetical protein
VVRGFPGKVLVCVGKLALRTAAETEVAPIAIGSALDCWSGWPDPVRVILGARRERPDRLSGIVS